MARVVNIKQGYPIHIPVADLEMLKSSTLDKIIFIPQPSSLSRGLLLAKDH